MYWQIMPLNKLTGVLRPSCGLTSLSIICPSYGKLHQNLAFSYKDHTNSLKKMWKSANYKNGLLTTRNWCLLTLILNTNCSTATHWTEWWGAAPCSTLLELFSSSPSSFTSLNSSLIRGNRHWDIPVTIAPTGAETTRSSTAPRWFKCSTGHGV